MKELQPVSGDEEQKKLVEQKKLAERFARRNSTNRHPIILGYL